MFLVRSTIDLQARKKETQALTWATRDNDPNPGALTTVVGPLVVRFKRPLSIEWAQSIVTKQQAIHWLSIIAYLAIALIPAGLLWMIFTNRELTETFLLERTVGTFLFWIGCGFGLVLVYALSQEGSGKRSLPVRHMETVVPPVDEDVVKTQIATTHALDDTFTKDASALLARAILVAGERATPVHALDIIRLVMQTSEGKLFAKKCGIQAVEFVRRLTSSEDGVQEMGPLCDRETYALLHSAFIEAYRERRLQIGVLELLMAALQHDERAREALKDLEISIDDARNVAAWVRFSHVTNSRLSSLRNLARQKPRGNFNLSLTSSPTPFLNRTTTDLTRQSRDGKVGSLVGRDDVLGDVFRILNSRLGNVLLVGEPGAGKSEILLGIGQLMASEQVPKILQDKRLLRLDPGSLIAGAEGVGAIEGRVQTFIREAQKSGNVLVAIEDIHHLLGAGSTRSSEDAGGMLMNALSEGKLSVIATTTTAEYSMYIRPREAFARRFHVVHVPEMDRHNTIRVLEASAGSMEKRHGVTVSYAAVSAAHELTERYMPSRHFPDKALRMLEEGCANAVQRRGQGSIVTRDDVAIVVEKTSRTSVTAVSESQAQELLLIEDELKKRIVAQDEAIHAIGAALRRARTGLRRHDRPIGTLLFLGPTGVGKTETAKAIADLCFKGEDKLLRLDLSEFRTPESLEKLLGKTGHSSPFLDAVRRCPGHLLLLDEFEKACPDVLNVFLQLFEDGRLTDGKGQTVSFTESLVIATSNLGSLRVRDGIKAGKTMDELRTEVIEEELLTALRPELVNRFDRIILFRPLAPVHMPPIVSLQLESLGKALEKQGLSLEVLPEAITDLAQRGFDPLFGARGLRRLIQDTVEDEVAKLLLQGRARRRDAIVLGSEGAIAVRGAQVLA